MNHPPANNLLQINRPENRQVTATTETDDTNLKNMLLLIQLRWIAVVGQVITVLLVQFGLGIKLPLLRMFMLIGALVLLNVASYTWLRHRNTVSSRALLHALMLDVLALTMQLYLSGGATNPFAGLYLLQITLGAVLLNVYAAWSLVSLSAACLLLLTRFNLPLPLDRYAIEFTNLQVTGMLVCYGLDAALLVVFVTRIARNLRLRDQHLAELQQRAAEEEHIVRMGLLASGAAHELSTPLSSVAVILGDWRRMPAVTERPDLLDDIDDMQSAIKRCKAIVTGILLSAGEARGEAPVVTTVAAFLKETVSEWRTARPQARLNFYSDFGVDVPIVSDSALKQVVANLLDNAAAVSPQWLELRATREADQLLLRVTDAGPGFSAEMLENLGKPYRSTKGRKGGGLGLFLVVSVLRKLGGTVVAHNQPQGGACVTVTLPLEVLRIGAT